jgi:hypothetical protein
MSRADEYRQKAALMREQAATAPSREVREDYERMAHGWEVMARRAAVEPTPATLPSATSEPSGGDAPE